MRGYDMPIKRRLLLFRRVRPAGPNHKRSAETAWVVRQFFCANILPALLVMWCWILALPLSAQETQPEARLVQFNGQVHWLHDQFDDPVTQTNLSLHVGNGVKTLENSAAVVWFRNDN